jgi:hypothetical protein
LGDRALKAQLEGDSLRFDPAIDELTPDQMDQIPRLRNYVIEKLGVGVDDVLAYMAPATGTFGHFRLVGLFPLPPGRMDPILICIDGPTGKEASEHRIGDLALCLYYPQDPPERRWKPSDGLLRLFDLGRRHLLGEDIYRKTGRWPIEEAPHGESEPAAADNSITLGPPTRPARNQPCPCGSGLKSKRCCFR